MKLIDRESCNLSAYHGEVTEKMLCAGLPQGGVDTCQVGGPVQKQGVGWAAPRDEIVPSRAEISWEAAASCTCEQWHSLCCGLGGSSAPLRQFVLGRGTAAGPCSTRAGTGRWWASSAGARAAGTPARPASTPASVPISTGSTPSGGSVPSC